MSGLEILAVAAGVLQIAELGGKLSVKLFTFTRKIKNADRNIDSISQDIAATGAVLQQLGVELKKDEKLRLCSPEAIATAKSLMEDCHRIFKELDDAVDGKGKTLGSGAKVVLGLKQRLKYPFLEPQIEMLKANLEKLKSSLLVMLNVLIFAEQLKNQEALPILKDQRELLKSLVEEKVASQKQYDQILKRLDKFNIGSDDPSRPALSKTSTFDTDSNITLIGMDSNPTNASAMADEDPLLPNLPVHLHHRAEELFDHCRLINAVIQEVNHAQYKIDLGIRYRTQELILNSHYNEWAEEVISEEFPSQQPPQARYEFLQQCPELKRYWLRKDSEKKPSLHGLVPHQYATLQQQMQQQAILRQRMVQQQQSLTQESSMSAVGNPYAGMSAPQSGNHTQFDYQMQLMLLEQRNKKMLMLARQEPMLQSRSTTVGREMQAQSASEFFYSQTVPRSVSFQSTDQAPANPQTGPPPHYVSAKRSRSPTREHDLSKRPRVSQNFQFGTLSYRVYAPSDPTGTRGASTATSHVIETTPAAASPSKIPGRRHEDSSCETCTETKIRCGRKRPRCVQCNLNGLECKYPVFLTSRESQMVDVIEMPANAASESGSDDIQPTSPAYSSSRGSEEAKEIEGEDVKEKTKPIETGPEQAKPPQSPSQSASLTAGPGFSDLEPSFNLDFSGLDNTEVLENFDFDSFLNSSEKDAEAFSLAALADEFPLEPSDTGDNKQTPNKIPNNDPPTVTTRDDTHWASYSPPVLRRSQRLRGPRPNYKADLSFVSAEQSTEGRARWSEAQDRKSYSAMLPSDGRSTKRSGENLSRRRAAQAPQEEDHDGEKGSAVDNPEEPRWIEMNVTRFEEESEKEVGATGRRAQIQPLAAMRDPLTWMSASMENVVGGRPCPMPRDDGAMNGTSIPTKSAPNHESKGEGEAEAAAVIDDDNETDIDMQETIDNCLKADMDVDMLELMEKYTTLESKELVWITVDVM